MNSGIRYNVWGIPYQYAKDMVNDMENVEIKSCTILGGVAIWIGGTIEFDSMNRICKDYETVAILGTTRVESDMVFRK